MSLRVSSAKYVSSEADSLIQNNWSTQTIKPATCGLRRSESTINKQGIIGYRFFVCDNNFLVSIFQLFR